jgi:hypothetical protein
MIQPQCGVACKGCCREIGCAAVADVDMGAAVHEGNFRPIDRFRASGTGERPGVRAAAARQLHRDRAAGAGEDGSTTGA